MCKGESIEGPSGNRSCVWELTHYYAEFSSHIPRLLNSVNSDWKSNRFVVAAN
jgi:hypothetical protein